jgi:hypothetical protein
MEVFLPSPLVGEGGAERSSATGEGFLRLGELCENVLQYGRRLLQHVIVPAARDPKAFGYQGSISRSIALRVSVLTAIDLNDEALFKANEIENEAMKWDLPAKFEERESPIAKQSPHGRFRVGRFAAHLSCKTADALRSRPMVWRLRREPLTRRLTS